MMAVILLLVMAVVAMGAWIVIDRAGSAPPSASEMRSTMTRMLAAWNDGDRAAIRNLYASDAVVEDRTIDVSFEGIDRIAYGAEVFYDVTMTATPTSEIGVTDRSATVVYTLGPLSDPQARVAYTTIEVNGDGQIERQVIVPTEALQPVPTTS